MCGIVCVWVCALLLVSACVGGCMCGVVCMWVCIYGCVHFLVFACLCKGMKHCRNVHTPHLMIVNLIISAGFHFALTVYILFVGKQDLADQEEAMTECAKL